MIEQPEAEHDVELSPRQPIGRQKIGLDKAVTRRIDAFDFEHERGLLDMHRAGVDAQHEIGAAAQRGQRPEPGVAAEIEHAPPGERAAARGDERIEKIRKALRVPRTRVMPGVAVE